MNSNPPFSVGLVAVFYYLSVARIDKQAVPANVNKPSEANVCRALCHDTEFISVTYDPQITHGNKSAIENKVFGKNRVH